MTKPIDLQLSLKDFDGLHKAVNATRSSSTFVSVRRQSLVELLMDHARLLKLIDHRNPEDINHVPKETPKAQTPGAAGAE